MRRLHFNWQPGRVPVILRRMAHTVFAGSIALRTVLITGGAGFIGSHLAAHFEPTARVRVIDNFRSGHRRNLDGLNVELFEGSILDRALVRKAMRDVDAVFHLAAMVSVPESMEKPIECVETNVTGLLVVLEEAAAAGVQKLCFASSAAVYGDNPGSPKVESMRPEPRSPYAITNLDGEYYCAMFAAARGLETAALRFFNVFGPRQDPGSAYAAAIPTFIRQALDGAPLVIFGDGMQTRDFIHVSDVVGACAFVAARRGLTGVFNAGYGSGTRIGELARRIIHAAESSSEIRHEPARQGDVRHSVASVEKLQMAGFRPSSDLRAGLADTLSYFKSQLATA
jgi:UDP-glucose 4-epimerase